VPPVARLRVDVHDLVAVGLGRPLALLPPLIHQVLYTRWCTNVSGASVSEPAVRPGPRRPPTVLGFVPGAPLSMVRRPRASLPLRRVRH
jgi:hypothetical protein